MISGFDSYPSNKDFVSLFSDATSTADVSWHQITYEDNKKLQ